MYNVYGNTRDIETCALFVWFVLVRSWFVHPQSARARSARTRTNQKRLGKTPMDVRSCRMVRVDFIWVWFVSGSFWFVLVRAGSFSLFFDFFTFLQSARARSSTNQNEPETNQTQIKSTRTRRHYRASMAVLPSLRGRSGRKNATVLQQYYYCSNIGILR
jgi:hypothetical protein